MVDAVRSDCLPSVVAYPWILDKDWLHRARRFIHRFRPDASSWSDLEEASFLAAEYLVSIYCMVRFQYGAPAAFECNGEWVVSTRAHDCSCGVSGFQEALARGLARVTMGSSDIGPQNVAMIGGDGPGAMGALWAVMPRISEIHSRDERLCKFGDYMLVLSPDEARRISGVANAHPHDPVSREILGLTELLDDNHRFCLTVWETGGLG